METGTSAIFEMDKKLVYMMGVRPILRKNVLFSDGTEDYRSPSEPKTGDTVTIRFRTARNNVDSVWLCMKDQTISMELETQEESFDYYACRIPVGEDNIQYYFKITTGFLVCYYDRRGVSRDIRPEYAFQIVPGFSTPAWAKGAVMYQLMVDRFFSGDLENDVLDREYSYIGVYSQAVKNWNKYPAEFDVAEFYGGDLQGVIQKLDYLQELGVEAIYFNPLFVSPSSHKYDIQDYDYIDPHLGVIVEDEGEILNEGDQCNTHSTRYMNRVTNKKNLEASNQLFIHLVEEAHSRGIKVILDGVFNHCGSFNKWLDREGIYEGKEGYPSGAYMTADSPYRNFFHFHNEQAWPNNGSYDGWWGHDTLPKLNYEGSRELYDYILGIARKWVSPPYNADGWRLDVAADLGHSPEFNHKFWRDFRRVVKEANPDALVLAEHYGDPGDWLSGDQWDTVMNYDAFMEPITWFLTGMEKHSDEYRGDMRGNFRNFKNSMGHFMTRLLTPSLHCAMNELSNHDHSRFLTRTNHKVGRAAQLGCEAASQDVDRCVFKEAVVFQMTWPGAPTVYYGDEAGVCGFTDPDNRRTYPWGREDLELLRFHKEIIRVHKKYEALRTGSVKFLDGQDDVICYARFNRREQFVIILNNDTVSRSLDLSLYPAGIPKECEMEQVIYTTGKTFSTVPVHYEVKQWHLQMFLPGRSALVLRRV